MMFAFSAAEAFVSVLMASSVMWETRRRMVDVKELRPQMRGV